MNKPAASAVHAATPIGRHYAAKIAREFGRLFRDGRGRVADIADNEANQVAAFLDAAREPIIMGLLPNIWKCTEGGYGCFVIGPDGRDTLRISDDFRHWHVHGKESPGANSGVRSLMFYLGCGRLVTTRDMMQLLGSASARVLLGKDGAP